MARASNQHPRLLAQKELRICRRTFRLLNNKPMEFLGFSFCFHTNISAFYSSVISADALWIWLFEKWIGKDSALPSFFYRTCQKRRQRNECFDINVFFVVLFLLFVREFFETVRLDLWIILSLSQISKRKINLGWSSWIINVFMHYLEQNV